MTELRTKMALDLNSTPRVAPKYAFDRVKIDSTVRHYDADGRLHVRLTNISKANVCPYYGWEIPDADKLGLDPERRYMLYRDPGELETGAATSNNIQLLMEHIPVSADDHQPDIVAGCVGTDAVFEAPYLKNSLAIWVRAAIDGIEDETRRELSCAYRYDADMTPGTTDGVAFDGYMRNIVYNHVSLVPEGRAGSDVIVADEALKGTIMASKALTSRKALLLYGAVSAAVLPKLAQDAKVDLVSAFDGVTRKNAKSKAKSIASAVIALTKGKLAEDAELDVADVTAIVRAFDAVENGDPDEDDLAADEDDDMGEDEDPKEEDKPKAEDEDCDDPKDKKAMDAAIAVAVAKAMKGSDARVTQAADAAAKATITRIDALNAAKVQVLPHVGEVMGMDSAEDVYRFAFDKLDVDVSDVHPSAFSAMMRMLPKPGATTVVVMDAAQTATGDDWFEKNFGRATGNA